MGDMPALHAGIVDCFVRLAKCQGILSFWRGNLANVSTPFSLQPFAACGGLCSPNCSAGACCSERDAVCCLLSLPELALELATWEVSCPGNAWADPTQVEDRGLFRRCQDAGSTLDLSRQSFTQLHLVGKCKCVWSDLHEGISQSAGKASGPETSL